MDNNVIGLTVQLYRKVMWLAKRKNYEKIRLRNIDYSGQDASDYIKSRILDDKPCMICRFGAAELDITTRYLELIKASQSPLFQGIERYIDKNIERFWFDSVREHMKNIGGFFPNTDDSLKKFGNRMIHDINNVDILGSWLGKEVEVSKFMSKTIKKVNLSDLEPYSHIDPWSIALKDKVVLVIHPYEESIQNQYKKHELLFNNPLILPKFTLLTIKAIQSLGGNVEGFESWFDALDYMCEKISCINFDIAIIGAGPYGLHLASYVKQIGKKSIHLGGATQILFGIKGKRWDDMPLFQNLYNQYWVRPSQKEVPDKYQSVEGGCYW